MSDDLIITRSVDDVVVVADEDDISVVMETVGINDAAAAAASAAAAAVSAAATAAAVVGLAPLASPALTGTPTAPTAAPGTNTTQLATTGFVKAAIDVVLGGVSAALDTLAEIATELGLKAPLASPALTGTPTAPTAAPGTNTTQLATTAHVYSATREKLTAARTYYVRTDGSDGNNGLTNTAGGAFLTIQAAINAAASLDSVIYDVTAQVGNGTYAHTTYINLKNMVGAGSIIIVGDETTPSNVVVSSSGAGTVSLFASANLSTTYKIRGVRLKSTATIAVGISASLGSYVEFQNIDFNTGLYFHVQAYDGGNVRCTGNYTISGGAVAHIAISLGTYRCQAVTITLTGIPAFSGSYVDLSRSSIGIITGNTYSGSATGVRYLVGTNAVLVLVGTTFPGNAAGQALTGGQVS